MPEQQKNPIGSVAPHRKDRNDSIQFGSFRSEITIEGRTLSDEEMENLIQYFDEIHHLTDTLHIVTQNIKEAKDTKAASSWMQWLHNANLKYFDSIQADEEPLHVKP